ncbi:MAG: BamA/TamA family outer membrane protein [Cytophagales bacterium]|nr:BamA/TamA family outer membrane protein [Cytophagales bacterium]
MTGKKILLIGSMMFVLNSLFAQDFSVFLMGDAGEPKFPEDKNLNFLKQKVANASEEDVLIFLGDNLYPKGLPDEEDPERAAMEKKLIPQLEIIKNFKGKSFIIPGNHDWAQGRRQGLNNVRNMERFVTAYTGKAEAFLPKNGCPGPEEIILSDKVTLIILDTQYFLHSQEKAREADGCEAPGTSEALELFEDMIVRNANKHIIVAAHHPLYTYGPHGGKYKFWKANLFPLTEAKSMKNLYIPLPGLGTIYWVNRAVIGNIQDIPNPKYKIIRNVLVDILKKADNVVWASGHEHSLQYITNENAHYVVSGSGSKTSHVVKGKGTQFYKKEQGFAEVAYEDAGAVELTFWSGESESEIYRKELYSKNVITDQQELANRPDYSTQKITIPASKQYGISKKASFWLGENYRKTWETPIEVPFFDVNKEYGGLEILKRGGGRQTLSLRMEAEDGKQYVLRSIEKDPSQLLPKTLRRSFAADFLQDQISSSHPYGALAVPKLADAAGVYHANPKLVYVPSDPAFGKFRYAFEEQMYLYEERPNDVAASAPFFGEGDDVKGTLDLLDKEIYEDNDNWIDQRFVLRSRMFDMLIGDWDRHDDQWRWVGKKNEDREGRRYRPIPRDRDQAFFVTDGLLPKLAASKWAVPSSEGFDEEVNWAPGLSWNMRWFDRSFINEPEWEDWDVVISDIQANVTDDIIDEAIKDLPKETYELTGPEIARILKVRREKLKTFARELYEYLSKEVEVVGTNKHEHFLVERLNDNETRVTVTKRTKDGDLKHRMYQRTFLHNETREIRLYGLGGQDVFDIEGDVRQSLKVRIIGGKKKDVINDQSTVKKGGKKTVVYDKIDKTVITYGKETKSKLSDNPEVNAYNRKGYVYDKTFPLISAQYNPDNGLYLGGGFFMWKEGWRKSPHASQHLLLANAAFAINSFNFKYDGKFFNVLGKAGLELLAEIQEPFFVSNFFGYGNETTWDFNGEDIASSEEDPIDFYRLETDRSIFRVGLLQPFGGRDRGLFRFGTLIRQAEVERDDNRFIDQIETGVDPDKVDRNHFYYGLDFGLKLDTRDNAAMTTQGIHLDAKLEHLWGLNNVSEDLTRVTGSFSFFTPIKYPARLVIANRVGVDHIFGNDFEFFNASQLGGWTNLRGFRRNRFYGQSAFYHNLDLRLKLFSFTTYIFPGQFGILAFQDVGRVWIEGENSDTWHVGRGIGAYIAPLDVTAISFNWTFTDEEDLFSVRFGWFF